MKEVVLDCCGLACPQPVIKTKEALENGAEQLVVIVDNEASRDNVTRFARSRGCGISVAGTAGDRFELRIRAGEGDEEVEFDASDYACPVPEASNLVYVISADSMGRGSEELGWALLQTYIQTIEQVDPLPRKILFYNSGVKLVTAQSGALDALRRLRDKGVEILACGTCLDFFKLKSEIQVGQISNMYDIMSAMSEADKVVSPY
jgi:selenium metabolism protein YedF